MEPEQAQVAVQSMEAAPNAGAGNGREREKSSLLNQMSKMQTNGGGEADSEGESILSEPSGGGDFVTSSEVIDPVDLVEGMTLERGGVASDASAVAVAEGVPERNAAESELEGDPNAEIDGRGKAKNFRGRWDHLNEQERRVVELTTKRGLTLNEAYRAVYGSEARPAGVEHRADALSVSGDSLPAGTDARLGAAGPEADVSVLEREVAGQQRRVEELKREKSQAMGDLAAYDAAAEAYFEARERLRELEGKSRIAAEQASARVLNTRRQAESIAREALGAEFPDALTPGTELYEACAEELAYLREVESPLIRDPQVEYKIARRMARSLGYQRPRNGEFALEAEEAGASKPRFSQNFQSENQNPMRSQDSDESKRPHQPSDSGNSLAARPGAVVARRTVRPVPAGGAPVEALVFTLERRVANAKSSVAMLELMREIGTPFEALLKK